MDNIRQQTLQNQKHTANMIEANHKHMVSSFESTRTLYHESEEMESAVSDICSYSINSGSVKTNDAFHMGEYFALLINDIGIAFIASVEKNNSRTCYVWTKFGSLVIPNLSAGNNSQNYHLQVVLEHYCNITDISTMIKQELPHLDLPRVDYELEIRHLVSIAIKGLIVVRDEKIIRLLRKYQDEMKLCSYIIVDVIIQKDSICDASFEELMDSIGVNEHSFQNYPFGSNPSPFLDSLGISSYKAPRMTDSKEKPSKVSWKHEFNALFSTEKSYLKSLKSLKNHYYNYLREAFEKFSYDHICVDLDDLIDLSEGLISNTEKISDGDIGEILCAFDTFLDKMNGPFSKFILQANAAKLFIKPNHEKAFNECARLFGAPFNSLFSAPLQRITRYPMSLEQISRCLDSHDSEIVNKATSLARKARKIATEIDSCYCRELNRGFSRDLVNKLKISGKVVNAKHQFVAEFQIQSLNGKVPVDHILLILNHILIIVPKTSRSSISNDHILSEKEIEKQYDLKHTIILGLETVTIVESLMESDNDTAPGLNFQVTDKSHNSGHRHYFFKAKTVDEKSNIMRYINHFIVFSKFQKSSGLVYSEYRGTHVFYNFGEEGKTNPKDWGGDLVFSICKDYDLPFEQSLLQKYASVGAIKLENGKLSCTRISGADWSIDSCPFIISGFVDSMNLRLKSLVDNCMAFHSFTSTKLKSEAYLNLFFSILKNEGIPRSSSAFSILSRKSQASTRSSLLDFTRKITELVRTPSIKRHSRVSTTTSEMWAHQTHENNITPRKLGLPKNRAESFFLRPKTILWVGRRTQGSNEFNLLEVLRVLIGEIEKECNPRRQLIIAKYSEYIYETTKLSGKASVKETDKIIENFRGSLSGLSKFNANDLAKILVTLVTDIRMQKYLLNSSLRSCILEAAKEESNDSELIPYIRDFLSELPASNKRCLHLLLNHWKKVTNSPKYIVDLKTMADKLSIFISNEAVDFQHATLALESMIFYADTLFEDLEKMKFTYSDITLMSTASSDAFFASESRNLLRHEDEHSKEGSVNDASSNPRLNEDRIMKTLMMDRSDDIMAMRSHDESRKNLETAAMANCRSIDSPSNLKDEDLTELMHETISNLEDDLKVKLATNTDQIILPFSNLETRVELEIEPHLSRTVVESKEQSNEWSASENISDSRISGFVPKISEFDLSLDNMLNDDVLKTDINLQFKCQSFQSSESPSNQPGVNVDDFNANDQYVEDVSDSKKCFVSDFLLETNEDDEVINPNSKSDSDKKVLEGTHHKDGECDIGISLKDLKLLERHSSNNSLNHVHSYDEFASHSLTSNQLEDVLSVDPGLEGANRLDLKEVESDINLGYGLLDNDFSLNEDVNVFENELISDVEDLNILDHHNDVELEKNMNNGRHDDGGSFENCQNDACIILEHVKFNDEDSKDDNTNKNDDASQNSSIRKDLEKESPKANLLDYDMASNSDLKDDYSLEKTTIYDEEPVDLELENKILTDSQDLISSNDALEDSLDQKSDVHDLNIQHDKDDRDVDWESAFSLDMNPTKFQDDDGNENIEHHEADKFQEKSELSHDPSNEHGEQEKEMDKDQPVSFNHESQSFFSFDHVLNDKGTPPFEDALEYQDHGLLSLETSQLDLEAECIQGLALLKKRSSEAQD